MSLTCEISGEPLGTAQEEIVVTPSGHVCIKRLLLTKLAENGGLDPFESSIRELPLSEDQLVTLARSNAHGGAATALAAATGAPPRPQPTSLPNLLQLLQKEYDALVLELFDTRKALEDTRRELSQALYQNDAAVRVVARLSQERDAARQELERWNASVGAAPATNGVAGTSTTPKDEVGQPERKRRRLEPAAEPLANNIPEEDSQAIIETWQHLNKGRKAMIKAAAAEAPSPESLSQYVYIDQKAWHKSTNKGILCMAQSKDDTNSKTFIVTAGKDKQLVVYQEDEQIVQHTFAFGSLATCVDISTAMVVAGDAKGSISVFGLGDDAGPAGQLVLDSAIVDVHVHPTNQHILAATASGRVILALWIPEEKRLQDVGYFEDDATDEEYTCAAVQPDGLLYVAGTKSGRLHVWDFKNKVLAANLKDGEESDAVTSVSFSNNGYYIAAAHSSAKVHFWDLRKQKVMGTVKEQLQSVNTVVFDKAGKYAAMGGKGGVKITTVKEWDTTASMETKHPVTAVVWSKTTLEVASDKERAVHFFGVASSD